MSAENSEQVIIEKKSLGYEAILIADLCNDACNRYLTLELTLEEACKIIGFDNNSEGRSRARNVMYNLPDIFWPKDKSQIPCSIWLYSPFRLSLYPKDCGTSIGSDFFRHKPKRGSNHSNGFGQGLRTEPSRKRRCVFIQRVRSDHKTTYYKRIWKNAKIRCEIVET